jgi:hypothetical protein
MPPGVLDPSPRPDPPCPTLSHPSGPRRDAEPAALRAELQVVGGIVEFPPLFNIVTP